MKNSKKFSIIFFLLFLFFNSQNIYALTNYVFFSVNGDTTLKITAVQGDTISWGANCAVGAQLYWQIWIDTDSNGVPDAGDKLLFDFVIADGDTSSQGPPPDISPTPDGWYISQPFPFGIAPTHYVFKVMDLSDSSTAQRKIVVTPLPSPPNKFTGWVTIPGHSAPDPLLENIWIEADDSVFENAFWAGLTNDSGYYEINVGASGTGHTFMIQPSDIQGFVTPVRKNKVASGVVDSVNFAYQVPIDSIYGQIKDDRDSLIRQPLWVWCSPRFSGPQEKESQTSDGNYKIYFGASELGDWDMDVGSEYLVPNYLVPNTFQFNNQAQHGIQHDFICQRADTVIYGRVTESGGLPAHPYKIQAYSSLLSSSTEGVSGTGSNNSFILHISSKDSSGWTVQLATWDNQYPIPTGYILEGGSKSNISPGDTVLLNLISGKMVRDTVKLDPGDPGVNWDSVWLNFSGVGKYYGGNPDNNGVYTVYVDSGTYDVNVSYTGYLSTPRSRNVLVSEDTTGGLGFILNKAHAHISGTLSNVTLPLSPGYWVNAETDFWPNGYGASSEVDGITGHFDLYLCDGDWTISPPYISGYNIPPSQNLVISEVPDTLRTINFSYVPSGVKEDENSNGLPKVFTLDQNYPNPFNLTTELRYFVPEKYQSVFVSLRVYNLLGQGIRTLVNETQIPGRHSVIWDGKDDKGREVSSGIYFYRLEAGDSKLTKRMVLIK
jgi:hypothetical protein